MNGLSGPSPGRLAALSIGALVFVLAAACGGAGPRAVPSAPATSTAELEALYRARVDSALARFSDADAAFMTRMIGHHAQALEMAALVPARAASAEIRTLAARITTAQEAEIELMRRWLEDRGLVAWTGDHDPDGGHPPDAPGMLTPDQMRTLEAAEGAAFDSLFLTRMIQHHEGAVTMVERLFATPEAARDASTFRIASGIQVDQRSEIARMESLLETLGDAGRGA